MNKEAVSIFMTCDAYHMYFKNISDYDFKTRTWKEYVFVWMSHPTYVIPQAN